MSSGPCNGSWKVTYKNSLLIPCRWDIFSLWLLYSFSNLKHNKSNKQTWLLTRNILVMCWQRKFLTPFLWLWVHYRWTPHPSWRAAVKLGRQRHALVGRVWKPQKGELILSKRVSPSRVELKGRFQCCSWQYLRRMENRMAPEGMMGTVSF